ncbi:hypothetical protein Ctha_2440 [Chloroherpeton thalassium ATCC 35110]|uniref:Uncharacterized protein n=1 Tax=Chloroherpeton thalassium (strain ATCC 35110 / GB-78) TaxID=517418 RepID=B3QX79_CHLT3|nr:hypothetical protein Ctha_2440 [Chloroherpeton thalassium ATCC 35110]
MSKNGSTIGSYKCAELDLSSAWLIAVLSLDGIRFIFNNILTLNWLQF